MTDKLIKYKDRSYTVSAKIAYNAAFGIITQKIGGPSPFRFFFCFFLWGRFCFIKILVRNSLENEQYRPSIIINSTIWRCILLYCCYHVFTDFIGWCVSDIDKVNNFIISDSVEFQNIFLFSSLDIPLQK